MCCVFCVSVLWSVLCFCECVLCCDLIRCIYLVAKFPVCFSFVEDIAVLGVRVNVCMYVVGFWEVCIVLYFSTLLLLF